MPARPLLMVVVMVVVETQPPTFRRLSRTSWALPRAGQSLCNRRLPLAASPRIHSVGPPPCLPSAPLCRNQRLVLVVVLVPMRAVAAVEPSLCGPRRPNQRGRRLLQRRRKRRRHRVACSYIAPAMVRGRFVQTCIKLMPSIFTSHMGLRSRSDGGSVALSPAPNFAQQRGHHSHNISERNKFSVCVKEDGVSASPVMIRAAWVIRTTALRLQTISNDTPFVLWQASIRCDTGVVYDRQHSTAYDTRHRLAKPVFIGDTQIRRPCGKYAGWPRLHDPQQTMIDSRAGACIDITLLAHHAPEPYGRGWLDGFGTLSRSRKLAKQTALTRAKQSNRMAQRPLLRGT
jgi:hypothetical protein